MIFGGFNLLGFKKKKNSYYVLLGLTFHGLGNVKSLKLRKNNIKFLMDGAFFGLNSMEQLYLDRNQVTITGVYSVYSEYIVHSIV